MRRETGCVYCCLRAPKRGENNNGDLTFARCDCFFESGSARDDQIEATPHISELSQDDRERGSLLRGETVLLASDAIFRGYFSVARHVR